MKNKSSLLGILICLVIGKVVLGATLPIFIVDFDLSKITRNSVGSWLTQGFLWEKLASDLRKKFPKYLNFPVGIFNGKGFLALYSSNTYAIRGVIITLYTYGDIREKFKKAMQNVFVSEGLARGYKVKKGTVAGEYPTVVWEKMKTCVGFLCTENAIYFIFALDKNLFNEIFLSGEEPIILTHRSPCDFLCLEVDNLFLRKIWNLNFVHKVNVDIENFTERLEIKGDVILEPDGLSRLKGGIRGVPFKYIQKLNLPQDTLTTFTCKVEINTLLSILERYILKRISNNIFVKYLNSISTYFFKQYFTGNITFIQAPLNYTTGFPFPKINNILLLLELTPLAVKDKDMFIKKFLYRFNGIDGLQGKVCKKDNIYTIKFFKGLLDISFIIKDNILIIAPNMGILKWYLESTKRIKLAINNAENVGIFYIRDVSLSSVWEKIIFVFIKESLLKLRKSFSFYLERFNQMNMSANNLLLIRNAVMKYYNKYQKMPKNLETLVKSNFLKEENIIFPVSGRKYVYIHMNPIKDFIGKSLSFDQLILCFEPDIYENTRGVVYLDGTVKRLNERDFTLQISALPREYRVYPESSQKLLQRYSVAKWLINCDDSRYITLGEYSDIFLSFISYIDLTKFNFPYFIKKNFSLLGKFKIEGEKLKLNIKIKK